MKSKVNNISRASTPTDVLIRLLKQWGSKLGYLSVVAALPGVMSGQDNDASEVTPHQMLPTDRNSIRPDARMKAFNRPAWLRRQSGFRPHGNKSGVDIVSTFTGTDDCPGRTIPAGTYTTSAPYQDSGDTTGANNTVTEAHWIHYVYYWYNSQGPDHVYSFSLTSRGSGSQLRVTSTSPDKRPMVYVTEGTDYYSGNCTQGTGFASYTMHELTDGRWNGSNAAAVSLQYVPLNKKLYIFVDSAVNDAAGSGQYTMELRDVTVNETAIPRKRFDFDVDDVADLAVYRPSNGTWYINRSTQGLISSRLGSSTDKIVPADYDGDGKTDFAVFRDGTWYWINSSDQETMIVNFGLPGDVPVPGDYTGDGRSELAVFRGGQWWTLDLSNNQPRLVQYGQSGDIPVAGDYDADGRMDSAVYRGGRWYINRSSRGPLELQWGVPTDKPVIGDYDNDGRTDAAVYRDGTWYIRMSDWDYFGWYYVKNWGLPTDIPVPADYDGDGQTELAVYRDGTWYISKVFWEESSVRQFGSAGDKPIPAAFIP